MPDKVRMPDKIGMPDKMAASAAGVAVVGGGQR